ncbi:hypothetical protein, partial [Thiorhodococcus mannitoliphagus]|uniref:hypothetical protein n=1 Tax=Thiorhodococcus mannitoliphagus TaxID=329406 RepID=UPI00197E3A6F
KTAGYTQAGIEAALSVRRSDNTPLSVIPLFSHKIYNGNSANNGDVGPYSLGRVQLDVAHDLTKVKRVAYWNSSDSEEIHNWIYQVDPSDWCNMPVPTGLSLTR